jgi:phosphinothricin acetyltransferase
MGRRRSGAGRALYEALFARPIGNFRRIGWKHGQWRDVAWVQRPLSTDDGPPSEFR